MAHGARRGRPRLTDEQRAEQRAQLLAGAMDAIRTRGPEVPIDEIAVATGVSKPVIYGHFGDRFGLADAIAMAMADRVTDSTVLAVSRQLKSGEQLDFEMAVGVIVDSLFDLVENEPEIYGFLVRTIRSGERGFFDNALVEVIRERGGALAALATPSIAPDARQLLVDGAFGFLLFAIESWIVTRTPPREEIVVILTEAVGAGFATVADRSGSPAD